MDNVKFVAKYQAEVERALAEYQNLVERALTECAVSVGTAPQDPFALRAAENKLRSLEAKSE